MNLRAELETNDDFNFELAAANTSAKEELDLNIFLEKLLLAPFRTYPKSKCDSKGHWECEFSPGITLYWGVKIQGASQTVELRDLSHVTVVLLAIRRDR